MEYGHGLFGSDTEVTVSPQEEMANREGMMYCATDWFGWADSDVPNAVLGLSDLSLSFLADRGQQGELNFLYLQRLMINRGGFASNPAFQYAPGKTFIDLHDGVYYDGNSQGGIFGGTVCAVSIDAQMRSRSRRHRLPDSLACSVDYVASDTLSQFQQQLSSWLRTRALRPTTYNDMGYSNVFDLFYPNQAQRQLIIDLLQTLWDRADPDGYARHMTATAMGGLLPDCTGRGSCRRRRRRADAGRHPGSPRAHADCLG